MRVPSLQCWRRYVDVEVAEVDDEGTFPKIYGEGIVYVILVDDEGSFSKMF